MDAFQIINKVLFYDAGYFLSSPSSFYIQFTLADDKGLLVLKENIIAFAEEKNTFTRKKLASYSYQFNSFCS